MGSLRLSIVMGLALVFTMAVPVSGQEGGPTCEEAAAPAGGGAHLRIDEQLSTFVVDGCNFQAGEQVTVETRLQSGVAEDSVSLGDAATRADSNGTFEVSFRVQAEEAGPIDYSLGYHLEVTATGSAGSEATAGVGRTASGDPMMPETGAGGTAGTASPIAPALVAVVITLLGVLMGRRLAVR